MQNPYKVLGVSCNSSRAEQKKAYRRLCSIYHPDSPTGCVEKFNAIQKAWDKLRVESTFTAPNDIKGTGSKSRKLKHTSVFTYTKY